MSAELTGKPCVLIVDDNEANTLLLRRILEGNGYRLIECSRSVEVEGMCRANRPDLMILDLHMPELDGFEVLANLRRIIPDPNDLPILVFTADVNPESALRALELGATDFLTKPGNPAEITLRVRNALHAQQMHKALVELRNSLEEKVSERTHALWQSQIEILERLTRLANWRHEGSASHSRLVAHLSWRIARELGLSPTEAELIRLAAPLLDIGEVGIPDAILAKRGLLTDNELNIVCSHCQIGAEVLSGGKTRLITLAEEIAHTHHEKWNGSGYPRGLWREQIPIAGRIVALADSYYSLRTERAHRRAFSHEEALEDIQRESGKRFDPSVIEAFLRIEEEIVWPDGQAA